MSARLACTSALVMALFSVLPALGQEPAPSSSLPAAAGLIGNLPEFMQAPADPNAPQPEQIPTQPQVAPDGDVPADGLPAAANGPKAPPPILPRPGLSDWITYNRHGCCDGSVGKALPLMTELFLRSGVAIPLPNTAVGRNLSTGWEIEGGGRLLLFNPVGTRAWVVEASVSTQENWNNSKGQTFPLNVIVPGTQPTRVHFGSAPAPGIVTGPAIAIRGLNRTFVSLGGGREWYLIGSAIVPGRKLRIGVDGGGRWGSAKMDLTHLPHRTDTIGGLYTGAHMDYEIPCGNICVFYTGLRTEWDYTFMDILQRKSDIMGINALVTAGIRW